MALSYFETPPAAPATAPETPNSDQDAIARKKKEEKDRLFTHGEAKKRIDELINHFVPIKQKTLARRKIRNIEIDVEALKQTGELTDDETITSIRVCDSTIEKEKPSYLAFIKQSRRAAIFQDKIIPNKDCTLIEKEYTNKRRYAGWEMAYYEALDGGQTHAWATVEIEYSRTKPGGFNVDPIEHDKLLFWTELENLQASDEVLREYDLTKEKLREFVTEYGFEEKYVEDLIAQGEHKTYNKTFKVYKRMFRCEGYVYVCWYSPTSQGWLKAPDYLWRGKMKKVQKSIMTTEQVPMPALDGTIQTVPIQRPQMQEVWEKEYETLYPYRLYQYRKTEEKQICKSKGRIFLDLPKQEAQIALWSSFINGAVRASNVYASPKNATGDRMAIMDLELQPKKIYTNALDFWAPPYPTADILRAASQLDSQTQSESGQVAFAAVNREDSRKTAKEIDSAEKQSNLLDSVDVSLWAIFVREVETDCWSITQSLALQQQIIFLAKEVTETDMLGVPSTTMVNDYETIGRDYEIKASGEVDVIEKAEKRQKRQLFWGIISQTTLAMDFLIDMIREEFPEDAERYENALRMGDAKGAMLTQVLNVLKAVMFDEAGKLKPEFSMYAKDLGMLAKQNIEILGNQPNQENAA